MTNSPVYIGNNVDYSYTEISIDIDTYRFGVRMYLALDSPQPYLAIVSEQNCCKVIYQFLIT